MPTRGDGSGGIHQRRCHREQTVSGQAHALGAAGGAGGIGDAGRCIRQRRSLDGHGHPPQAQPIVLQCRERAAGAGRRSSGRVGDHALRATGSQRVHYLGVGEERRQWHMHGIDQTERQIQDQPVRAVVEPARHPRQPRGLQASGQPRDRIGKRLRVQRAGSAQHPRCLRRWLTEQLGETCIHALTPIR